MALKKQTRDKLPMKAFKFGCHEPTTNRNAALEQLFFANQFRNKLVEKTKLLKDQEKALLRERARRRGEVVEKESLTAAQVDYATLSFFSTDRSA